MKNGIQKAFAILVAAVLLMGASLAAADTVIHVSGTGETMVAATTAVVSLGVNAREKDVLEAQNKVNASIAAIREALVAIGVAEEDINTDYLNLFAIYDYSGEQEKLTAYNASSTLAIRVRKIEQAGEVIDAAFRAGANTLNGISFSAENTDDARADALKKAVADAKAKAEVLAEAAGLKIKSIEAIQEGNVYSYDTGANNFSMKRTMAEADTEEAAYGTLVQAAKLAVSATVTVTFEAE